jgi:hypothetical protein
MPDIIYQYMYSHSGEYLHQEIAQPDQMDGGYILPPNTTLVPPAPLDVNGNVIIPTNTWPVKKADWVLVADYRLEQYYRKTDGSKVIFALGDVPDGTMTPVQPKDGEQWNSVSGSWVVPPDVLLSRFKASVEASVQMLVDATAQKKGYDSALSCASYATDGGIFSADANAMILWRSHIWGYCYQQSALISPTTPLPTVADIISNLLIQFPAPW